MSRPILVALLVAGCRGETMKITIDPVDEAGRLEAIQLSATWREPAGAHSAILLVHGLGGSSADVTFLAESLAASGIASLAIDLRGHGQSGGSFPGNDPASYGLAANDVRGALSWMLRQADIDTGRVALFGMSLGGGAVIANALEHPDLRFVAWYPGLTYQHQGDSLVRRSSPALRGLIIQGTGDLNPRANPVWVTRFRAIQSEVSVIWIAGGRHGTGAHSGQYLRHSLDSLRQWVAR